ncbi:MAG: DNA translocase FtsK 4TM domain-containing protein, partial [Alistipes sp.]|nr:DNA translocase FtsK 4TM domain-containing protein [Alistipes sp.]
MATNNTTKRSSNGRQRVERVERTDSESARWIAGLVIIFVGFFAAASVLFSYFCWEGDQSGLQLTVEERETLGVTPENMCGWLGARVGMLLVDHSFGVFGILLPIVVLLLGVRVIRKRPLLINHLTLSLVLVMLLGSLTLGFAFGTKWSLCASTGWGGAFGIEVAKVLHSHIGSFGTIILLLGGWILTGVFINRNFINTVNHATTALVDRGGQVVDLLRHRERIKQEELDELEALDEGQPDVEEEPELEQPTVSESVEEVVAPAQPVVAPAVEERPALQKAVQRELKQEEDPFEEVDLSQPKSEERVVMGASGLVELARKPVQDGPFMEIDLSQQTQPAEEQPVEPIVESMVESTPPPVVEGFELVEPTPVPAPAPAPTPATQPIQTPTPTEGIVVVVEEPKEEESAKKIDELYDPTKDLMTYKKPPFALLEDYQSDSEVSEDEIFENKSKIEETLKTFGIPIQKIMATVGPTVTLYEIVQAQGVKIAKIQGLEQDIAQSLKASGIRIIAPI